MANPVILACDACGAKNRVPPSRFKDRPVCGRCKAPLPLGGDPFEVGDADFQSAVLEAPLPVLVDFWAPWCGPCQVVAPVLREVAREQKGKALVAKVDVDASPRVAAQFAVQSIPTLVLFRGGLELDRRIGAVPKEAVLQMVARAGGG